jgi:hypothetical protein
MPGPNWQLITQPGATFPGGAGVAGGGGYTGAVQFHDPLDRKRSMQGRTPEAEYPDGYLGTIIDRQQDKLLAKVQERLTDRSYQRGVHVGSKVGRSAYFWTDDVNPEAGLIRQSHVVMNKYTMDTERYAPRGNPVERLHSSMHDAMLSPAEEAEMYRKYKVNQGLNPVVMPSPGRRALLQKMLPGYV